MHDEGDREQRAEQEHAEENEEEGCLPRRLPDDLQDRGVGCRVESRRVHSDRELRLRARQVAPVFTTQDRRVTPGRKVGHDEREPAVVVEPPERDELDGRLQRRWLELSGGLERDEEHVDGELVAIREPDLDGVARPGRLRLEAEDEMRGRRRR